MEKPDWNWQDQRQLEVFRTSAAFHRNRMLFRIELMLGAIAAGVWTIALKAAGWL